MRSSRAVKAGSDFIDYYLVLQNSRATSNLTNNSPGPMVRPWRRCLSLKTKHFNSTNPVPFLFVFFLVKHLSLEGYFSRYYALQFLSPAYPRQRYVEKTSSTMPLTTADQRHARLPGHDEHGRADSAALRAGPGQVGLQSRYSTWEMGRKDKRTARRGARGLG